MKCHYLFILIYLIFHRSCFTPGVIELVDDDKKEGRKKAIVLNPRHDLSSRQIYMYEEFKDLVEINKIRNHFIFSIESTGALSCSDLMIQSVNILMAKSHNLLNEINRNKI